MKELLQRETCIPSTPLGLCSEIIMDEVFDQGSADAVLMAWNTMDARNKGEKKDMILNL